VGELARETGLSIRTLHDEATVMGMDTAPIREMAAYISRALGSLKGPGLSFRAGRRETINQVVEPRQRRR
jgi:hypothetical protein